MATWTVRLNDVEEAALAAIARGRGKAETIRALLLSTVDSDPELRGTLVSYRAAHDA